MQFVYGEDSGLESYERCRVVESGCNGWDLWL